MFEYPSQKLQDWLSQRWVMFRGRRINPGEYGWLMGPYGDVDVIADRFIDRLAADEDLVRSEPSVAGLWPNLGLLDSHEAAERLKPTIADFYTRTSCFQLESWSRWSPLFRHGGSLIAWLYARRLQQLNLPMDPLDTAYGIQSRIIQLRDRSTDTLRYTVWYRILKRTGRVIYSGVYDHCTLSDGSRCMKVIFPLPRGNATVILKPEIDEEGHLNLISSGQGFGEPGFYFLLRDRHGRHFSQYHRSFREQLYIFVDDEGVLRTDHTMRLWGREVLRLHYKITPLPEQVN